MLYRDMAIQPCSQTGAAAVQSYRDEFNCTWAPLQPFSEFHGLLNGCGDDGPWHQLSSRPAPALVPPGTSGETSKRGKPWLPPGQRQGGSPDSNGRHVLCVSVSLCARMCFYVILYMYIYVCMYVDMYVSTYIYIYVESDI